MVLLLGNREVTMDAGACFPDPTKVREAAARVSQQLNLAPDWLNDAVKGLFDTDPPKRLQWETTGMRIFSVEPDYLFAMKAVAAREKDMEDLKALADHLGLQTAEEALVLLSATSRSASSPRRPGSRSRHCAITGSISDSKGEPMTRFPPETPRPAGCARAPVPTRPA